MLDRLGPYLLGPNDTEENGIYTGDARELARAIPDESVDLIFTDPVYQNIDDYRWLAETAARVLKEDRACLVWIGNKFHPQVCQTMTKSLSYRWTLTLFHSGVGVGKFIGRLLSKTSLCLWLEKGQSSCKYMWDISIGVSNKAKYGNHHKWGKDPATIIRWLSTFCDDTGVTLDFYSGGGTVPAMCKMLGHRYLAFEIDPAIADTARQRVRDTQPPLFVLQPYQMALEVGDSHKERSIHTRKLELRSPLFCTISG
jgi:DNA modification methylase